MSALFVANHTFQRHDLQYRVLEHEKVFSTIIPAGAQVQLPIDFNEAQIRHVIQQLEHLGARPANDVRNLTSPHCLLFSTKEITSNSIDEAREKDEAIRQNVSDDQVAAAGVAVMHPDAPQNMRHSELSVRELDPTDREQPTKNGVDIKVTVDKRATNGPARRRR